MSKPVLLSLGAGKVQELAGTANNDVLTWDSTLDGGSWKSAAGGGGGSGTVTSVGLTGGTSGIVIGGTTSPITTSGTYNLDAPLRFAFNTATPTAVAAAGQVSYNTDEGSLEQMFDGGHVKSVLGQTLHQRVLNETGSTLTKGQVVYVNGAQGNRVTVSLAQADADSTSATIIGLVAYAIADAAEGYVITEGVIKGVNTNGFTEGLPVYLSPTTPGALTQTKPEAPQHLVLVGYCVRADTTVGEILVKTQNGYELGELHDVYINSPTSGQILIYDATAGQTRWENASLTGTANQVDVTPGPGSLSLSLPSTVQTSTFSATTQVTTNKIVAYFGGGLTLQPASGTTFTLGVGYIATAPAYDLRVIAGASSVADTTGGTLSLEGGGGASGNANGGDAKIDGGASWGTGIVGRVYVGTSANTSAVYIGSTNVKTTLQGPLTGTDNTIYLCPAESSSSVGIEAVWEPGYTGAGRNLVLRGGTASATNTNGGNLELTGGAKNGTGTAGRIYIGTSANTSVIWIGTTGVSTLFFGPLVTKDSTTSAAGFRLPPGTAPTSPTDGDLWTTTSGLFAQINGATQQYAPLASPTFTGTPAAPTAAAGTNTTQVATTAFVTTAIANAAGVPYDLPCEIPGTPTTSTRVVNFEGVRAFVLATSGHQGGCAVTNPSSNTAFDVKKISGGTTTTLGTITFNTDGTFSSSITATLADRTFAAGDVLTVTTPAALNSMDTPFFTFFMTLA